MKKLFLSIVFLSFMLINSNLFSQGLAPKLINPENNADCQTRSVDFQWEQKPSVTTYDIKVSGVQGDYSSPVLVKTGLTKTNYTADLPDNDMTYYWKVTANYSGTFAESEEFTFKTVKGGTSILQPDSLNICVASPIEFSWVPILDANSYQIQISTNQSFAGAEIDVDNIDTNVFKASLNESFTKYFWRVRAEYTSGTLTCYTEWSEPNYFSTAVKEPTLDLPLDKTIGADFSSNFSWTGQLGANRYILQIADDPDFNNIEIELEDLNQSSTFLTLPTIYNKTYYWRVKASNFETDCYSNWSNTFSFKTRYEDVTLNSPANQETCIPVNGAVLTWDVPQGVSKYRLQVSETAGFPSPIQFDIANLTSNTYTLDLPASLKTFYWRVRAEDSTNIGNWSPSREFKSGLFSPNLKLPVNDSTETYIKTHLEWNSLNAISNYNLQVATNPDFQPENMVLDTANLTDKTFDLLLDSYGKSYYWRVSSTFTPCLSNWSETYKFTTMTGTTSLNSPANNATETQLSILFDWSDVLYAKNYDIEISSSSNFDVIEKGRIAVDTSLILISGLKPTTKYYWRVRANTEYSKAPYSEVFSFTTGVEPSIRPLLISPKNLTEKNPTDLVLVWSSSDKATFYELQASKDENFVNVTISQNNITDTTFVLTDLDNYQVYSWRVRSGNSAGVSSWTEPWKFKTVAPSVTATPVLESPADNATEINHKKAAFKWFEVENVENFGGAYNLQVATDSNFTTESVVVDTRAVYANEFTIFTLSDTKEYFWRVRGFNEAGDGPWSEAWSFKTLDYTSVSSKFIHNVELYPNPAHSDKVNVKYNLVNSGITTIKVVDLKGNVVSSFDLNLQIAGDHTYELNVNNLSSGNYFVIIENGNDKILSPLKITK